MPYLQHMGRIQRECQEDGWEGKRQHTGKAQRKREGGTPRGTRHSTEALASHTYPHSQVILDEVVEAEDPLLNVDGAVDHPHTLLGEDGQRLTAALHNRET